MKAATRITDFQRKNWLLREVLVKLYRNQRASVKACELLLAPYSKYSRNGRVLLRPPTCIVDFHM